MENIEKGLVTEIGSKSAVERLVSGQRVHWTEMTARKRGSFRMSTKEGKVVSHPEGQIVIVRYRGKDLCILRDRLRVEGEKTELTDLVMDMAR